MSDRESFLAIQDKINAIPDAETISPDVPVEIEAKEAEMLYSWVPDDKPFFTQVNFDWSLVESLPNRIGAARYTEVVWCNRRIAQKDAQKQFADLRVVAEDLKDEILAAMDLAFCDNADLAKALQNIRAGSSNADLVMDMTAIYDLGTQNSKLLEAINFNMEKLTEIEALGSKLASILGAADADKLLDSKERIVRDKAYTYLKTAVDKIRKCGKYACRGHEDRLKGYISQYTRMLNRKKRSQQQEKANETKTEAVTA